MADKFPDEIFKEYVESSGQLTRLLMKEVHSRLSSFSDLHHTEVKILKTLSKEGVMSQHDIAQELCHTDASISKLITNLVEKKYVTVQTDPDNRRRAVVQITTRGQRALEKVEKHLLDEIRSFFDGITKKELMEMISINKKLAQNILTQEKDNI